MKACCKEDLSRRRKLGRSSQSHGRADDEETAPCQSRPEIQEAKTRDEATRKMAKEAHTCCRAGESMTKDTNINIMEESDYQRWDV